MILHSHLPYDVHAARPLPGIQPLGDVPLVHVDEVYGAQMAYRRALLATRRADVLAQSEAALPACREALRDTLDMLPDGFDVGQGVVTCTDGARVALDWDDPLASLCQIVQEDICILQKQGDAHVLTAAALCFPASWRLGEKFMHPLIGIHEPVAEYDADLAKRVQRLFDGIRVGLPLWRFNALWYDDPDLHQPRSQSAPRPLQSGDAALYLRSERQILRRLPDSEAVVFSIHTYVLDAGPFR